MKLIYYDYLRIIKRRKYILVSCLGLVLLSTLFYTKSQIPMYQASAVLRIEPAIADVTTEMLNRDMFTIIKTEIRIIKSAVIAELTAKKLNLITDLTPPERKQAIILSIQDKIDAEGVGDTNLIRIIATSSVREEVAPLANTVAEIYIEKRMKEKTLRATELREFIESQLKDAKIKLNEHEQKLIEHTGKGGIAGLIQHIAIRITDLETKKQELLKKYTEIHPEIVRLNEQLKSLELRLKALSKEEIEYARLTRELKLQEEIYSLLAKKYKEAQITESEREQTAFIVTPAVEPISPIIPKPMRNYTIGTFLGLLLGLVMCFVVEHFDTSVGTIEDVEKYFTISVIGVIPHIVVKKQEMLKFSFKKDKVSDLRKNLVIYHSPKSPFVDAYHTLRTNLKLTHYEAKSFMFTSSGIGEGKTLTSLNFALAAANSGIYTLYVEADMRRPTVHKVFGVSRLPGFSNYLLKQVRIGDVIRGVSDLLLGELSIDRIVHAQGIENFRFIPAGLIPPNPVHLFTQEYVPGLMNELNTEFELIVYDSPPVLLFADALLLSSNVDGVILIYNVGKMARSALKRTKDQLISVKANILGVVLNDIKASEMEPGYGYYYAYRYYMEKERKR